MLKTLVAVVTACTLSASAQAATTYTYAYRGPTFAGGRDHVAVTFTIAAPLAPSTSYLDEASAGVTASSVAMLRGTSPLASFTLPVTTFQIHTDAAGAIDAWFILGDASTVTGAAPTM